MEPLRHRSPQHSVGAAFRVSVAAWSAVAAVVLALAAVVAVNYDAVRGALERSVTRDGDGASAEAISDTATITLLGSGAVALVLLLLAAVGLSMAAARKSASGIVLLIVGLATIGASIAFWSFMSDAGAVAAGALQWGSLVCAGVAAVATVAASIGLSRR